MENLEHLKIEIEVLENKRNNVLKDMDGMIFESTMNTLAIKVNAYNSTLETLYKKYRIMKSF